MYYIVLYHFLHSFTIALAYQVMITFSKKKSLKTSFNDFACKSNWSYHRVKLKLFVMSALINFILFRKIKYVISSFQIHLQTNQPNPPKSYFICQPSSELNTSNE